MMEPPLDYAAREDMPPRWFAVGITWCCALAIGLAGLVWILI